MKSIYIKVTVLLERNGQHIVKPFRLDFNYCIVGKKEKVSLSKIKKNNLMSLHMHFKNNFEKFHSFFLIVIYSGSSFFHLNTFAKVEKALLSIKS